MIVQLKKICSFFLLTILSVQGLFSQEARQYSFKHYNVNNGLASYVTTSVVQDEQGYIWIGTLNGLQRFDGTRFITFKHNPANPNSIPYNSVSQLLFDKQNRLWVTFSGDRLGIFDTKRFTYKKANVKLLDDAHRKGHSRLTTDAEGKPILAIAFHEAVTYNEQANEFAPVHNQFTIPENWHTINLVDDARTKKMWIACKEGMVVYNKRTKNMSYYGHNTEHEPLIDHLAGLPYLTCYLVDSKHRFWFFDWQPKGGCRIHCYNLDQNSPVLGENYHLTDIHKYNEPALLMEQKDGTIWISGLNVFSRFDEATGVFTKVENEYKNDQSIIYDGVVLFEDRERNIWVATSNNGLYVFNPATQLFRSVGHINRVTKERGSGGLASFVHLNNGDILGGYWGEGLFRYDHNLKNIPVNIKGLTDTVGLSVWNMIRLKDQQTICMVGQPAFIAFYNQANNSFKKYTPAIFQERTIRQVAEDRFGNLWFGSHSNGIYKWDAVKGSRSFEDGIYKIDAIPSVQVLDVMIDSKGYVWIGTTTAGVYKIDPATEKIVDRFDENGPADKRIVNNGAALLEYNDSLVIIAGGGLNFYNTKTGKIRRFTSADGLPSDLLVSLEKDKAGYLWIGSTTGLYRMNIDKATITVYDRNDGMANDNFDVSTNYQLPDGRMLFGTTNDFVVFDPMSIKTNASLSDVSITYFKVLNNSISVDSLLKLKRVELQAHENSITIGFSNLGFNNNKSKVTYFYMMEDIDKEWKQANELNQAIYNYLPAGTYTFKIRTENADGVPGKNITTLKIKIHPPFWKSWWFISLLIILMTGLLYWIDRLNMKRKEGLQKMRSDIADNLHDEVNQALNNINILSEMARIKADTDPQKSKEYIEQINARSHNMIDAMDDMLWSLGAENDSMQKTVERMREFIDALKMHYGVNYEILVDENLESLQLNMKLRYEAFLLFKEVIKGLVQARAKECSLRFGLEKNKIVFSMQFQNNCCDLQHLTNLFQRTDIEKHMQSIHATPEMQVLKRHTVFMIRVPVR